MVVVSCIVCLLSSLELFSGVKFRAQFEFALQKDEFVSVVANHSKSGFFYLQVAEREEIRSVYSTKILVNTATIREVKLSCI